MKILITSILAFISTNIDDIFILTLFYGNKKFREREIIVGQLVGIIALIAISMIGSLIGLLIDHAYIGLLGFIPIFLGAKGIVELIKTHDEEGSEELNNTGRSNNFLAVAGVTIANGGDNIGIYIPLFAALTWLEKGAMISIFLLFTFVWCMIAKYFVRHPYVAKIVNRYGHIITPFVLILLGIFILYENETFKMILNWFEI